MDELDPPVHLDAHETGLLSGRELYRIDRLSVGSGQGRGAQQRVARLGRKSPDAGPDERVEALWDRNASRALVFVPAVQLARDLDRVERVAARRLRDPHDRRSRKRAPELLPEHAVEGGDRERSRLDVLDPEIALERRQRRVVELCRTHREDGSHRLLAEPAQRELDYRGRRGVEPLEVVDRAHDLRLGGERAQERQESGAHDATLGRPRGGGPQERGVETHPLGLGESREVLARHFGEQIREPREREAGFRFGRPRDQDSRLRPGALDRRLPQRRLADPRLADDGDRARRCGAQEGFDRPEFRLSPDQPRHTQRVGAVASSDNGASITRLATEPDE